MTSDSPAVNKLFRLSRPIKMGYERVWPIPANKFTKEEIEELRNEDSLGKQLGYPPFIANFLPDDIRPKGIPKM